MPIPVTSVEVWFQFLVTGDNEPMFTHLAYARQATITQAAVDAGFSTWQANWRTRFHSTYQLIGGHVLEGATGGSIRWDSSVVPAPGTNAGVMAPNNCAILVKKSTDQGGRRNRGRMFIPGVIESEVDQAGILSGTAVSNWNTELARLMPGGVIHTAFGFLAEPQLLHDSGSQTPATVTDLATQAKIATQRRRMRR